MANKFGTDILIQAPAPKAAARFYVRTTQLLHQRQHSRNNRTARGYQPVIEPGPALRPVLEVTVDDVEEAERRLVKHGSEILKDAPHFPRRYVTDPYGLIYNLTK